MQTNPVLHFCTVTHHYPTPKETVFFLATDSTQGKRNVCGPFIMDQDLETVQAIRLNYSRYHVTGASVIIRASIGGWTEDMKGPDCDIQTRLSWYPIKEPTKVKVVYHNTNSSRSCMQHLLIYG